MVEGGRGKSEKNFIPVPDNILGPGSVVAADMDAGPLAVNPEDALVHRVKG